MGWEGGPITTPNLRVEPACQGNHTHPGGLLGGRGGFQCSVGSGGQSYGGRVCRDTSPGRLEGGLRGLWGEEVA